jgi:hypothetical protein
MAGAGWQQFCAALHVDPEVLLRGSFGWDTVTRTEPQARALAFTADEAAGFLRAENSARAGEASGAPGPASLETAAEAVDCAIAAALCRGISPGLRYLVRLRSRMERAGFLPDDPLFQLVSKAYDAVQHLSVHLHYLSCKSGVGRAPGTNDKEG